MLFLTTDGMSTLWLWIMIAFFIVPVFVLSLLVFTKIVIKQAKKRASEKRGDNYLPLFGGADNIISVERKENRISIEVNDLNLVNFDDLRELSIGVMVIGKTIKCSSADMAEKLEHIKKK
ncbi:MAG: hypothetical protein PHG08_02645 [Bacilli bacterium]|jgi:hypothetical protein|nr:hypothetical protein [Bacilli bacterium]HHU23603.1 hypothetical protein [Acholeplasmataceae bacterium]